MCITSGPSYPIGAGGGHLLTYLAFTRLLLADTHGGALKARPGPRQRQRRGLELGVAVGMFAAMNEATKPELAAQIFSNLHA